MQRDKSPVRPFGKYGPTYLIDRSTGTAYRICSFAFILAIVVLGEMEIFSDSLSHPLFYVVILFVIPTVGATILWTIASHRGVKLSRDEAADSARKPNSKMSASYKCLLVLACFFCGIMAIILGYSLLMAIVNQSEISINAAFLFVVFLFICLKGYRYLRTSA
jgi:hypothetical protein